MRHVFLAESDYAACGAAFMRSVYAIGGQECRYYAARPHIYHYPHQPESWIPKRNAIEFLDEAIDWADWVWVIQSDLPMALGGTYMSHDMGRPSPSRRQWLLKLQNKRVALLHGGGHYRDYRGYYKQIWGGLNPLSICYESDLMGSFTDEHLVVPPLDPRWLPQRPRNWERLRVGHFPSRPTDKGSEWIVPMLQGMPVEFRTSVTDPRKENGVHRVPWLDQMQRMSECDVIIDQVKPSLGDHRFGEWVSIATETAMLGRIPIANSLDTEPYVRTYGRMPGVHICNTPRELETEINRLASLDPEQIEQEQQEAHCWAQECHSIEATARVLARLLGVTQAVAA